MSALTAAAASASDMYCVKKEIRFEAAHRLFTAYEGKCRNLHGHSWKVTVDCLNEHLDKAGMARDFSSFSSLKDWVEMNLDHATLVGNEDKDLLLFLKENKQKYYILTPNPTSEALAREIYEIAKGKLGFSDLVSVRIEETCSTQAKFRAHSAEIR